MRRKGKKPSRPAAFKIRKGGPKSMSERSESEALASERADTLAEELESAKVSLAEAEERHLRLMAEFENYRRRTRQDIGNARLGGVADFVGGVIPILHDLERAWEAAGEGKDTTGMRDGLELVIRAFSDLLRREGVTVIDPSDTPFDEQVMEAVGVFPSDTAPEGDVVQVVEKGYRMGERLIRPARVLVSSGKPLETPDDSEEIERRGAEASHGEDEDAS